MTARGAKGYDRAGAGRAPPGPREGLSPPPKHKPRHGCGLLPRPEQRTARVGGSAPCPVSLPERPDLDQLRRQAKELRDAARRGDPGALDRVTRGYRAAPQGEVTLGYAAQLVIARELGFTSWPRLKAVVESRAGTPEGLADAFVAASVERRMGEAATILEAHPGSPPAASTPPRSWATPGRSGRRSPPTPRQRWPSTKPGAGRRSFTPVIPDGTRSARPGRRGWPRWLREPAGSATFDEAIADFAETYADQERP